MKYYINKFKYKKDHTNSKEYIKIADTLFKKANVVGFDAAVIYNVYFIYHIK